MNLSANDGLPENYSYFFKYGADNTVSGDEAFDKPTALSKSGQGSTMI